MCFPRLSQGCLAAWLLLTIVAGGCDKTSCFVAGTLVDTPNGATPIERLRVGDAVYAYDERNQARVVSHVTRTFVHHGARVRTVTLSHGRAVGVTDEHPFYDAATRRYIAASELVEGVELLPLDPEDESEPLTVQDLGTYEEADVVYNIEVHTHHNYFVEGFLVHNKGAPIPTVDAGPRPIPRFSDRAERLAAAVCAREEECCPGNQIDCTDLAARLDRRWTDDGVVVDEAAYERCIAQVADASCEVVAVHAGRIPVFSFCEPLSSGTLRVGTACGAHGQCETSRCVDGVCAEAATEGESCGVREGDCASGLACELQMCVVPSAPGEPCGETNACTDGYVCLRADEEADATCQPVRPIGAGEECGVDTVCELGDDTCRCHFDDVDCTTPTCGDSSRCFP